LVYCVFIYVLSLFAEPAPPEISALSLHDALPICTRAILTSTCPTWSWPPGRCWCPSGWTVPRCRGSSPRGAKNSGVPSIHSDTRDRKSTRLNSSHDQNSYAVFCLKKKKKKKNTPT